MTRPHDTDTREALIRELEAAIASGDADREKVARDAIAAFDADGPALQGSRRR